MPVKDSASHTEESCHSADEYEHEGQEEYINQQGIRFMPQQQQKEGKRSTDYNWPPYFINHAQINSIKYTMRHHYITFMYIAYIFLKFSNGCDLIIALLLFC